MVVEPAPRVGAARASAAKPSEAAVAEPAETSGRVIASKAPDVECVVAAPPTERGSSIDNIVPKTNKDNKGSMNDKPQLALEKLRSSNEIKFEAPAGVIIGPADKNSFQKIIKPLKIFNERAFISYGEIKRYIAIINTNIFVYADKTDPSPLYTIPLSNLILQKEDPNHPDFYSHTVSPEANVGLPFQNKSRGSLQTVLLRDASSMKIAYQVTFETLETDELIADKFLSVVGCNQTEERKRKL